MIRLTARTASAFAVLAIVLSPAAAAAKSASSLSDLIGVRASGAETDMQNRGWEVTDGHKGNSASYTYWWSNSRRACVMVTTRDGRYSAIVDATPADCNRDGGGYGYGGPPPTVTPVSNGQLQVRVDSKCRAYYDRYGQRTMAVSGCDSDKLRAADEAAARYRREQGLDRNDGYNGGGYGGSTPTPKVSQRSNGTLEVVVGKCRAYYTPDGRRGNATSACEPRLMQAADDAAASFRREQGGYGNGYRGEGNGQPNYGGGPAQFSDLVGAKAAGVETDLQSRGFRNVDGFESGNNGKGTIWWNGRTGQCLQMITVNGRAESIEDIQTHQNCR
jgi:hypothetical protein